MKKRLLYCLICVFIPAFIVCGALFTDAGKSAWISLFAVIASCIPFFLKYERKKPDAKEVMIIAALTALSVVGRVIFTPLPGFKPVTAMVVITAMYFGAEAGFMTGALSAVVSNFYFGQGPWTPFQMFSWGIIGFIAGLAAAPLKKSRPLLACYAVISGVMYSLLMDVWTVLFADGYFNVSRYIAAVASASTFTVIYALSNLIFLMLFSKPIGRILEHIKIKYGL